MTAKVFPKALMLVASLAISGAVPAATVLNFPNFSSCAGLQLNGSAACTGGLLRLNPASGGAGSTFSTTTVALGPGATFSTFFAFQMLSAGGLGDADGPGADGLTFTVQPVSSTVGSAGGGLGYAGIPTSLAIEFDTFNNGLPSDINGNHVGVDLNGSVVSVASAPIATRMNNAAIWYAWIDYDGTTIELRLAPTNSRPAAPSLSYTVNLASVLGTTSAFVGFTSATGAGFETHDILQWQLNDSFSPIGGAPPPVATPIPTVSEWSLLLLAAALALAARFARRRA